MTCQRENISLLLIHESSFNPNLNQNKPFFYKLYDRIKSIDINLTRDLVTREKIMNIVKDESLKTTKPTPGIPV